MSKIIFHDHASDLEGPAAGLKIMYSKADGVYVIDQNAHVIKVGSAVSLQEVDGNPVVPTLTTIKLQQSDGLRAAEISAGIGLITLDPFTGDDGAGGIRGGVPAPAAGDAAMGKVLTAAGVWDLPGGGVTDIAQNNGRLTLVSSMPVMDASVFAAQTLFYTPHKNDLLSLFYMNAWNRVRYTEMQVKATTIMNGTTVSGSGIISGLTSTVGLIIGMKVSGAGVGEAAAISSIDSATQVSVSVNSTASSTVSVTFKLPGAMKYDVFACYNGTEALIEFCRWSSLTTRDIALAQLNGVYVKNGDNSRRFLGWVQTNADGEIENSAAIPGVQNVEDYLVNPYFEIPVTIGSRLGVPLTGVVGSVRIPHRMKITGWTMLADVVGSVVLDIWKSTYATYPPTAANTISASNKPTLSSVQKNINSTLSGWSLVLEAGDILYLNINSVSTIKQIEFVLQCQKWAL